MLEITEEQIEFLKGHRFYYTIPGEDSRDRHDYVSGYLPMFSKSEVEFYNMYSVNALIEELKENPELDYKNSILFQKITQLFEVEYHTLSRISKRKNRETGKETLETPIRTAFQTAYTRLIVGETEDYYNLVYRCNGDFGYGEQMVRRYYKSKNASIKATLPLIDKEIIEMQTKIGFLNELKENYIKELKDA
jgi:hypothetical protein